MTDLEQAVAESMRAFGDRPVDVTELQSATLGRARSAARRRALVTVAGLAAGVATGVAVAPVLRLPSRGQGQRPAVLLRPSLLPYTTGGPPAKLPPADVPAAAFKPASVGTDPAVLHFDIDLAAAGAAGVSWQSATDEEGAEIWAVEPDGYHIVARVRIGRALEPLLRFASHTPDGAFDRTGAQPFDVAGRPGLVKAVPDGWRGDVPTQVLWWQPVDGLWAVLFMPAADPRELLPMVKAQRFDRAQRCTMPARLAAAPSGGRWSRCSVDLEPTDRAGRSFTLGSLTFEHHQKGGRISISYGNITEDPPFVPNRSVAGRPARWDTRDGFWYLLMLGEDKLNMMVALSGEGFGESDAVALADAFHPSGDPRRPETWPARPFG